jgi:hypothetical protein
MTKATPEKIDAVLRDKARELLDGARFAIEVAFHDPKYQQLMWMAVAETAEQYASAAEREANAKV